MTIKYLYLKNLYRNMISYHHSNQKLYMTVSYYRSSQRIPIMIFLLKKESLIILHFPCAFSVQWQAVNCYGLIKKLDQHILFKHNWFAKIRINSRRRQSHRHRDFQRDKDLLYFPYQYCIKIETTRHHGPFNNVRVKAKH